MSLTNIVIIDDHDITLDGLVSYIGKLKNCHVVGKATSGKEALDIIAANKVDLVITDIDMPEMDGFELLKILKLDFPETKVIACTMHINSWVIQKIINSNTQGIISKHSVKQDIEEAIRGALNEEPFYSKDVYSSILNSIKNPAMTHSKYDDIALTKREKQILNLIANELTTNEIAEQLSLSPNTVESHRKNLFLKFDVRNVVGLIKKAMERMLID